VNEPKTVQDSSVGDSAVPLSGGDDGVQEMSSQLGPSLLAVAERKAELATTSSATAIQTQRGFAKVCASNSKGGEKSVASLDDDHVAGLAVRAAEIDAQYAGDVIEGVDLPQPIIDTAQRWLRSHNLIWSSNDFAFWAALEYVLDSLESFSIDAVEQALIICTTEASDDAARRSAIYQELRACRALKKIRDLQIRIRTAQVVAERPLSAPHSLAIRQQREADAEETERMREVSQAYVVFQSRDNYETTRSSPFQNLTDAQQLVQQRIADPTLAPVYGYNRPEIHRVGLNAAGEQVKDYGIVN